MLLLLLMFIVYSLAVEIEHLNKYNKKRFVTTTAFMLPLTSTCKLAPVPYGWKYVVMKIKFDEIASKLHFENVTDFNLMK